MNRILVGDALTGLAQLPDGCVQTCVTSPPYYGLRDYGVDGQIGLEASPDEFITRMVEVFRAVRRVLRADGTAWVNMGDSYASIAGGYDSTGSRGTSAVISASTMAAVVRDRSRPPTGYKPKDLMGMPWMLAFALRADGWYLRQDIIWHKPNPMPESVRDRCTKAHEYVFLLSTSERYYYDMEAVREPASPNTHQRRPQGWAGDDTEHNAVALSAAKNNGVGFGHGYDQITKPRARKLADAGSGTKNNGSFDEAMSVMPDTRNKRSVWTISTQAYKEAHFATFPEALVEPCILAGSRPGDLVLDPFMGSGTTAVVAQRLGRNYVGCELNPTYAAMANRRIRDTQPGLALA